MNSLISLEELHEMLGLTFTWKGENYTAIEIITQPLSLVAQKSTPEHSIQTDVHGRAHKKVSSSIITIPVFTQDGSQLHPEFLLIKL
ncbi:MAG: hypothetical protein ACYCSS_13285 [Sulfuriferula sp.]